MSRPGFALEVDERTPPLLVRSGSAVRLERFSLGTQVVYGPDSEAWGDATALTAAALTAPLSGEPLSDRLRPGMRLTITFSDVTVPTPWARDDVRRVLVEHVLQAAATAGVDDVVLIAANGLRRRLTAKDQQALLGERVCRSFAGDDRLRSHDAADADELVTVGLVDGVDVALNRRVVESDLVVHVGVVTERAQGGWREIATGLGSADTIDLVAGVRQKGDEVIAAVSTALPLIAVTASLGQPASSGALSFLSSREWEWGIKDQLAYLGVRRALAAAPVETSRALYGSRAETYPVLAVFSGDLADVDSAAQGVLAATQTVPVKGQADILVAGVPNPVSMAPDADGTPLAPAWHVLAHVYGMGGDTPIVRDGGAIIGFSKLGERFSSRHHSAGADFVAEVLPNTTDPQQIADAYQAKFAADPWYLELYRHRNAFHPLHPFHLWYAMQPAIQACPDIVWVGADRRTAEVMGFRAATTYADALEICSTRLGRRPKVTYVRPAGQVQVRVS